MICDHAPSSRCTARRKAGPLALALMLIVSSGCFDISLGGGEPDPGIGGGATLPAAFVVAGTMVEGPLFRPCPLFESESQIQYHLVQGDLPFRDYEAVTTIGASSVIEVVLRRELDLRCQVDDLSEVLEVIAVLDVQLP